MKPALTKSNADLIRKPTGRSSRDKAAAVALFDDTVSNPEQRLSPCQKAMIAANFRGMNAKMDSELRSLEISFQSYRRELTVVRYQTSSIITHSHKKAITDLQDQIHNEIFPLLGRINKDKNQPTDITIGADSQ